jgi:penicillin-binding protein 2
MNQSDSLHNNISPWRIFIFALIVVAVFLVYLGRLFLLQVIQGPGYSAQADLNRVTTINLQAPRGIIFDRNGTILAQNIASYNVVITPADLPDDQGEIQRIFRELSAMISVPVSAGVLDNVKDPYVPCKSDHGISQIVEYGTTTAPFRSVKIKCNVDRSLAMVIKEKSSDWPGVDIEVEPVRDYPTGVLTADVVGYLGPIPASSEQKYRDLNFVPNRDKIGYAGVENTFQDILAGKNGLRTVEWDAAGKILDDIQPPIEPVPGLNIRLTIDTRLQAAAEAIMEDELNFWNTYFRDKPDKQMTSGVAIAINPKTGEILAMISYPSYENNRMAREIPSYYYEQLEADARKPLVNHAVGDRLPAGSVFKLTNATGSLNEGVVTPEQVLETPGKIVITEHHSANDPGTPREFVDWNWRVGGFGHLDFIHAVANSSNVYFYKLGGGYGDEVPNGGLGICRLGAYAKALGYGKPPGTGLPEEDEGLVPDPAYKRINTGESWTLGDTYITSVGQGYVLATPLQVLMSVETIANNGKQMKPTLLREIVDGDGNIVQPFKPDMNYDLTVDPEIVDYEHDPDIKGCVPTGKMKTVQSWIFQKIQQGMRLAVTEGTLSANSLGFKQMDIAVAGKTGTAEYCDQYARKYNPCTPGNWPAHAWTVAFAPYDNPEIAVVAFVYNGNEGATTAGPIVQRILKSYFELKAIDNANANP